MILVQRKKWTLQSVQQKKFKEEGRLFDARETLPDLRRTYFGS